MEDFAVGFANYIRNWSLLECARAQGTHGIYVFAFDKAGNLGEASINVVVDLTLPAISDISVANGTEIRASTLHLTWSGSDAISGIDLYEIKLDKDVWINLADQTNYTFTYLPDGRHNIIIKAFDKAQNYKETSLSLVVNTSFLFGPGWTDDAAFFGVISVVIIAVVYYFFIKERKVKVSLETSAPSP